MTANPRDDAVEAVRDRTDIVELVGRYLKLKKVGSRYVGLCPFHAEKTPSFSVNPQKGFFHCFGCKASGDVYTFLMRMEGRTFPEALEELAARAGVELPARSRGDPQRREQRQRWLDLLQRAAAFYAEQLWTSPAAAAARTVLAERGVPRELAQRFQLGYAPAGWQNLVDRLADWRAQLEDALQVGLVARGRRGPYDMFRHRLVFPIAGLDGKVRGFGARKLDEDERGGKYINSPQGPLFDKSAILYGLPQARTAIQQNGRAVLVEGYFDVLGPAEAGVTEALATCGTALTAGHARLLKRFCDRVVTVFDGDEAGRRASFRAAQTLLAEDLSPYLLAMPAGADPDSFVRERGAAAFTELLDAARPSIEVLADQALAEVGQDIEARTRAVEQLLPLLRACGDGLRRSAYARLVAERFQIDERELRRALETPQSRRPAPAPPAAPAAAAPALPPLDELRLVCLLLQRPELAAAAVERGAELDIRDRELGELVGRLALERPGPAAVLDGLENDASRQWLAAALVEAAEPTADRAAADLELLLKKLRLGALLESKRELEQRSAELQRTGAQQALRELRATKLGVDREIQALGLAVKRRP